MIGKIEVRPFGSGDDGKTPTPGDWKTVPSLHGDNLLCVQVGDDESYTTGDMLAADAKIAASAPLALKACRASLAYDEALQKWAASGKSQRAADGLGLDGLYDAWLESYRSAVAAADGPREVTATESLLDASRAAVAEEGANRKAATDDLLAAAEAYREWERELFENPACWSSESSLPTVTQELLDRLFEIQAMRNAAVAKALGKS